MSRIFLGQHRAPAPQEKEDSPDLLGLKLYDDLAADVRYSNKHEAIKNLVQPNDPEVRDLARVLVADADFVAASQAFVHSFTKYRTEIGDYWRMPAEMLDSREGDCDDSAILLCSILRNYIPADKVFCAVGLWNGDGHMWVVTDSGSGRDRIVESTASPDATIRGNYKIEAIFNDRFALSTDLGLVDFDMVPIKSGVLALKR